MFNRSGQSTIRLASSFIARPKSHPLRFQRYTSTSAHVAAKNPFTFKENIAVLRMVESGQTSPSETLFTKLSKNMEPTWDTYMVLIPAYARQGRVDSIKRLQTQMAQQNFQPTTEIWGWLAYSYALRGDMTQVEMAFNQMYKQRLEITTSVTELILEGFILYREKNLIEHYLEIVERYGVMLSIKAYNALIRFYGDCGDVWKFEAIVKMLESSGIEQTAATKTIIVNSYTKNRRIERAFKSLLVVYWENPDYVLNECGLKLLVACSKHKEALLGEKIYDLLTVRKVTLPIHIEGVNLFLQARKFERAIAVALEKTNHGADLYEVLLPGLAKYLFVDQVTSLLSHMETQRVSISRNMIVNIMLTFANQQRFDVAEGFKRVLDDMGVQLTRVQYLKLIRGGAISDRPEQTKDLMAEMAKHHSIGVDVYYFLISGFVSSRHISHAQTAFDHMLKKGLIPDEGIYRAMVNGYALSGTHSAGDVKDFIEMMTRKYSLQPDVFILSRLAGCYIDSGDLASARSYLIAAAGKLPAEKYEVSVLVYCYNRLLQVYFERNLMPDAAFFYDQMDALRVERNIYTFLIMILGYWRAEKLVAAGAVYSTFLVAKRPALFRLNRELLLQRRLIPEVIVELERLLVPFFDQPLF